AIVSGHILLLFSQVTPAAMGPGRRDWLPRPGRSAGSCSACGPLSLPLLAGLVAADAVVSLLIVGAVFLCARLGHRPTQEDGRVYINMPGRG
uniref:Hematopoietic cell signal transducer n=1 Tax=Microcebus murinus TaxID=30608 RepID=A0A8C5W2H0_MICMU